MGLILAVAMVQLMLMMVRMVRMGRCCGGGDATDDWR